MKNENYYEMLPEIRTVNGIVLHRIRATRDNAHVSAGTVGGFIENPRNLIGDAWIADDACVYGGASVACGALAYENA